MWKIDTRKKYMHEFPAREMEITENDVKPNGRVKHTQSEQKIFASFALYRTHTHVRLNAACCSLSRTRRRTKFIALRGNVIKFYQFVCFILHILYVTLLL